MKRILKNDPIFVDWNQCTRALTIGLCATEDKAHTEMSVSSVGDRDSWSISEFVAAATCWLGNALSGEYQDYIATKANSWDTPTANDVASAMWASIGNIFFWIMHQLACNMKELNVINNNNGLVFKQEHIDIMFNRALSRITKYAQKYEEFIKEEKDNLPI